MMEEDIFENAFQEASACVYVNPDVAAAVPSEKFDYAENVVNALEQEFKGLSISVPEERKKHKEDLNTKLASLTKQLRSIKNVKNHRMRHINEKNAERRKKLRVQIESVKDDLYAIDLEEKGSEVSSTSLVDATVHPQDASSSISEKELRKPQGYTRSDTLKYITASNSKLGSLGWETNSKLGSLGWETGDQFTSSFNEREFPRLDI